MDKDPSAIERVAFKVPPPHSKQRLLEPSGAATPRTLAVDVGGSHVKATVLSADGTGLTDEVQIATPHPCPPAALLKIIDEVITSLPDFDRVSVGFPGFVRRGTIVTHRTWARGIGRISISRRGSHARSVGQRAC